MRPQLIVHGHYHSGYTLEVDTEWGGMQAHGLDCDGATDSLAILECAGGEWSLTPVPAIVTRN